MAQSQPTHEEGPGSGNEPRTADTEPTPQGCSRCTDTDPTHLRGQTADGQPLCGMCVIAERFG
jgi:hypothetical protein